MLLTIAFYVFATVTVVSALMVVSARNPVHSVLFLILAFFNGAGLLLLLGAEFLAMLMVIVYVGAVAVLFLFVVMMLDVDFVSLRQGFLNYLPTGALIGLVLLAELILVAGGYAGSREGAGAFPAIDITNNTRDLGRLIYTEHVFVFQSAGVILLVAMIGAITLTLRKRPGVKRQDVHAQVGRKREDAVRLVDVKPGQGI